MANHRSVLISAPANLIPLIELAGHAYLSADICSMALREIQGYYEIRGNDAVLAESGFRPPSPDLISYRMQTLRERIPRFRDETLELWKEFAR